MKSGKRKFITFAAIIASLLVCGWMTNTTEASMETVRMNGIVLGIMIFLILIAYFCGIRKVNKIITALGGAVRFMEKAKLNAAPKAQLRSLQFSETYLKEKFSNYLEYQRKFPEAEIDDFINGDEISTSTHRDVWEMFSDFLTSIGILGTFIGLIIGLQGFNLNDLTQFSVSVSPLLDGIKVAFLTSVYGMSLSLSYSYGLLSAYGDMEEAVDIFLDKFHVLWGKEPGNDAQVLAEQKEQTEMLRVLTETFQEQLAASFEEVITPTIMKLNDQFGEYSEGQRKLLKDAAAQFAEEFKNSFVGGFAQFEKNLEKTNAMQTQYMTFLDHTMSGLTQAVSDQQTSMNSFILKSAEQQKQNMEDVGSAVKKVNSSVNALSKANERYYDSVVKINKDLEDNGYYLLQGIQSFVEQIGKFAGELGRNEERDYSEILTSMQSVSLDGLGRICEYLQKEQSLLEEQRRAFQNGGQTLSDNQRVLEEIHKALQSGNLRVRSGETSPQVNGLAAADQTEVLNQILAQMRQLVELESRRENRGTRRRLFGRNR